MNLNQQSAMTPRFTLDAEYIQGGQGLWLLTRWRAADNDTALLILPPFAEEMNCCRRVFASLAATLAGTPAAAGTAADPATGIDCFLPDFYGTGDSEGDFRSISLQQWRQDILSFLPQLAGYRQVHLLGCRFAAALLLDWLADIRQILPLGQVLLWQPQLDARRFWQQLQRLQQFGEAGGQAGVVAANTATNPPDTLSVAGYAIPRSLQSEALALNTQLPADVSQLHWFESTLTGQLSPASLRLQQNHPNLLMQAVNGQPYWLSQEPVDTQALLDATITVLRGSAAKNSPTSKVNNVTPETTDSIAAGITATIAAPQIIPLQLCGNQSLGIYHAAKSDFLIVLVNGGAQTKAGSHRMQQQLASHWQQAGFASLRFDFPGFGDAEGAPGDFIDHARYLTELPAELQRVFGKDRRLVLFGLCDGATAALLASPALQPDALLLLNPWCRLQQNHARTMLKFYYLQRLISKEFWQKLLTGRLNLKTSVAALRRFWQASSPGNSSAKQAAEALSEFDTKPHSLPALSTDQAVLQAIKHWQQLTVPLHLTLSGADLTAAECAELLKRTDLQRLKQQAECLEIAGANHTLSGEGHLAALMQASVDFLRRLPA